MMTQLVLSVLACLVYAPQVYGIVRGFLDGPRRDAPPQHLGRPDRPEWTR